MSNTPSPIEKYLYFPTLVYMAQRLDFLKSVMEVSEDNLREAKKAHPKNEIYPVYMSQSYFNDPRIADFSKFVAQTAWDILKDQGYNMENKQTFFTEMWTQEHSKHSLMEQHTHKFGAQIVGFYFLDTPEGCSRLVIHDPRPAKTIVGLDETNMTMATEASDMINFEPKPGMIVFTNGWLPHSFGRHAGKKPIKFVHFNLSVQFAPPPACPAPAAEII